MQAVGIVSLMSNLLHLWPLGISQLGWITPGVSMQAVVVVSLMSGLLHRRPLGISQLGWITPGVSMQAVVVVSLMSGLLHLRPLGISQVGGIAPRVSVQTVVVVLLVLCLGGLGRRLEHNQETGMEQYKCEDELLHKHLRNPDKTAVTFLLDCARSISSSVRELLLPRVHRRLLSPRKACRASSPLSGLAPLWLDLLA